MKYFGDGERRTSSWRARRAAEKAVSAVVGREATYYTHDEGGFSGTEYTILANSAKSKIALPTHFLV
jgi:hypothetical protein